MQLIVMHHDVYGYPIKAMGLTVVTLHLGGLDADVNGYSIKQRGRKY